MKNVEMVSLTSLKTLLYTMSVNDIKITCKTKKHMLYLILLTLHTHKTVVYSARCVYSDSHLKL